MATVIGRGVIPVSLDSSAVGTGLTKIQTMLTARLGTAGKVGGGALAVGIGAAVAAGVGLYKVGKVFDDLHDTIVTTTGKSGKALKQLEADARAVGKTTPSSFSDIGKALSQLNVRTGQTGKPLQRLTSQILNLTRMTGTDLETNVKNMTRLFKDWSVPTNKQSLALDKLFVAAQKTGIGVDTLSELMVKFGSPLRQLGLNFDFTAAMFANFEKSGVNIQTAMPGLRMGLKNIINLQQNAAAARTSVAVAEKGLTAAIAEFGKGSPEAIQAQQKLSMAQEQLRVSMMVSGKSIPGALRSIMSEIKNTGSAADANALAMKVFGTRAGPDLAAAIREGRFNIKGLEGQLKDAGGAIDDADKKTRDFGENWQIIKNNLLIPLRPLALAVFNAIGTGSQKLAAAMPGIMKSLTPLIRDAKEGMSKIGDAIKTDLLPAFREIMPVVAPVAKFVAKMFGASLVSTFVGLAKVIHGIVDVIAGAVKLVDDLIHGRWKQAWSDLGQIVSGAVNIVKGLVKVAFGNALFRTMKAAMDKVLDGYKAAWEKIKSATSAVFGAIKSVIGKAFGWIKSAASRWWKDQVAGWKRMWDGIKKAVTAAWSAIKSAFGKAWGWIKSGASRFWDAEVRGWRVLWDKTKALVSGGWDRVKSLFSGAWNWIKSQFSRFVDAEIRGWRILWDRTVSLVKAGWDKVKSIAGAALGWLKDRAQTILSSIASIFRSIFQDKLPAALRAGVGKLKSIWSGIKAAFSGPVDAVIGIINKLISAVNWVLNKVGLGGLPHVGGGGGKSSKKSGGSGASSRKRASGGVLPGYTPGRDVHTFVSPTGGVLHLSGGEAVMRPEFTRAVGGKRGVDRLNNMARRGQRFQKGGIYPTPNSGKYDANDSGGGRYSRDIAVPTGTPVHAYKAGKVIAVQHSKTSYGNAVWVRAKGGGVQIYAHLSKTRVRRGQKIKKGQVVGAVGHSGNATGPHLHFELRGGGAAYVGASATGTGKGSAKASGPSWWEAIKNKVGGMYHSIAGLISGALSKFGLPGKPRAPGKGIVQRMLQGVINKVWDGVIGYAKEQLGMAKAKHDAARSKYRAPTGPIGKGAKAYKKYAFSQLGKYGWGKGQRAALVALWQGESGWSKTADNPNSSAYGIPQAMLSVHKVPKGYRTDARVQIDWGLRYIKQRYGSPKKALAFKRREGYYDQGGILGGPGAFLKRTNLPERVLSPRQTEAFDAFVDALMVMTQRYPYMAAVEEADVRSSGGGGGGLGGGLQRVELVVEGQRFPAYMRGIADGAVGDARAHAARRGRMRG